FQAERNLRFNSPKTAQIDDLFLKALGIAKLSDSWRWSKKMIVARTTKKLDKYVALRGVIAHRGTAATSIRKSQVTDYFNFVKKLVGRTGAAVSRHVRTVTPVSLWK